MHCLQNTVSRTLKKDNPKLKLGLNTIIAAQLDSLTDPLLKWYLEDNIGINLPSLVNPLVQTSSHSPKNYGRDMQVELTSILPIKLGSESLTLCFLDLRHNNNPKSPHNKNRKTLNHNSIGS